MAEGNGGLDKKFDEVLERLDYLRMVISNLKDRRGISLTDFGDIDEKLFREIANYEMSTKELKKDFILLLLQDARKIAKACVMGTNLYRRNEEVFDKIGSVLDFIYDHEAKDIEKSKELRDFAMDAKDDFEKIIKGMEPKIREEENEKKEYEKTLERHNKFGFG